MIRNKKKSAPIGPWLLLAGVLVLGAANWNPSRADDKTAYAAWIGTWEVTADGKGKDQDKFTLTLEQGRRGLYGTYTPGNGQAVGRVYEGVLRLKCYQGDKLKSTAQLKLSEDSKSFSGTAKRDGEDKEFAWNGTRQ